MNKMNYMAIKNTNSGNKSRKSLKIDISVSFFAKKPIKRVKVDRSPERLRAIKSFFNVD